MNIENITKSLNPFVQVPFTGNTTVTAVGRVALYGGLAFAFRSNKYAMYALSGAALVSALSSMSPVVAPAQTTATIVPSAPSDPGNTLDFTPRTKVA